MTWLPILAVAALAFALAAGVLKLPRSGWTLFGAALLFGLSGYSLQGSPGQPGAPREAAVAGREDGELLVLARREFYGPTEIPSRYVVTADAFTRRGQYVEAAGFLRNAILDNPGDAEAWLALGNVLVEHAEGQLTAGALYAYSQAEALDRSNPAPTYFLGLARLRAGELLATRALWAELVATAPAAAPWRPALADRLARLDALIAASGMAPAPGMSPEPPLP